MYYRSVAFDQRHFRPIDRNHHARGVGVNLDRDAPHFIGLGKGVDDVELPQLFGRHLDQIGIGVVVGLPVPEERVANALVDCVDRGIIAHARIVSEHADCNACVSALTRLTALLESRDTAVGQ